MGHKRQTLAKIRRKSPAKEDTGTEALTTPPLAVTVQRMQKHPDTLSQRDILQLQQGIGNAAVNRTLNTASGAKVQRLVSVQTVDNGTPYEDLDFVPRIITDDEGKKHALTDAQKKVYGKWIKNQSNLVFPNKTALVAAIRAAAQIADQITSVDSFEWSGDTGTMFTTGTNVRTMLVYKFALEPDGGSPTLSGKIGSDQVDDLDQRMMYMPDSNKRILKDMAGKGAGQSKILKEMYRAIEMARAAAAAAFGAFMGLHNLKGSKAIRKSKPFLYSILQTHFAGASSSSQIHQILAVLGATASGLLSDAEIQQVKAGDRAEGVAMPRNFISDWADDMVDLGEKGYSKKKTHQKRQELMSQMLKEEGKPGGAGIDVQIRYQLLTERPMEFITRIIVHEFTHKYAATADYGYAHNKANYDAMKPAQAVQNADSFAYAAMSVYLGRLVNPGELGDSAPLEPDKAAVKVAELEAVK